MQRFFISVCPPLAICILALFTGFSCGGNDPEWEGLYEGRFAMEDGAPTVRLKLMEDKQARLSGLYDQTVEGEWRQEPVGEGLEKNGIHASFDFPEYEIKLKMLKTKRGFKLMEFSGRKKGVGMSLHRPFVLKKANPELRRISG